MNEPDIRLLLDATTTGKTASFDGSFSLPVILASRRY